jgi:superfamily II DNA or RNA helicase
LLICHEYNTSLILVPNIDLVDQIYKKIEFIGLKFDKVIKISYHDTTNEDMIYKKLKDMSKDDENIKTLIISTYQSSHLLLPYEFDICCFDEAHHTCCENEDGYYRLMLKKGKIKMKFFFTATEKSIIFNSNENDEDDTESAEYSMDNKKIYGETLYTMNVKTAIEKGYVSDYIVNICYSSENIKIKAIFEFIKSKGKRIFIYANSVEKSKEICKIINDHEWDIPILCKNLNGDSSKKVRNEAMENFRLFEGISVICLCDLFGEGFDEPSIDTCIFYEPCKSEIKLIQRAGRSWRKFEGKMMANLIFMINKEQDALFYKKVFKKLRNDIELSIVIEKE